MKKTIVALIIFQFTLLTNVIFCQTDNKFVNIEKYINESNSNFRFQMPLLTDWYDGEFVFGSCKDSLGEEEIILSKLPDSLYFGIFDRLSDTPSYYLDTDNDSILDIRSSFFVLPLHFVRNNSLVAHKDSSVLKMFDQFHDILQSDNKDNINTTLIYNIARCKNDFNFPNRHLIYLLEVYREIVYENSLSQAPFSEDVSINLMYQLISECVLIYDYVPPIVCIYSLEALLSAGMIDVAKSNIKMYIQFHPNSIPLMVYKYKLEDDLKLKEEMLTKLNRDHGNHWFVKTLK